MTHNSAWKPLIRNILLPLFLLSTPLHAIPAHHDKHHGNLKHGGWDFKFESIIAEPKLVFHKCFDDFECTKLQVPLDHTQDNPTTFASIAIIKLASDPKEFPEFGDRWGGPILVNPGGPGNSGVGFALDAAKQLQQIVGRQFSIVSFDPRGVNNTVPRVSCFDSPLDRQVFAAKAGGRVLGSGGGEEVGEAFVRAKIFGNLCSRGSRAEELPFLGTASVAKDMLAINKAFWDLAASDVHRKGLQYWGFSYGSVLGATFAKMYPNDVERMILDGVLDPVDWITGAGLKIVLDADAVLDSFFNFCSLAGPLRCKFHIGTKPEDIRARLDALLLAVRMQPIPYDITPGQPDMLTFSDLKTVISKSLNVPLIAFPPLADLLAAVDASRQAGALPSDLTQLKGAVTCPAEENGAENQELLEAEAEPAILCSDGPDFQALDLGGFNERLTKLRAQSWASGDVFAGTLINCVGWRAQAKLKPAPELFTTTHDHKDHTKKGAAPILLIGNTADPLTPLVNTHAMAKIFPKHGAVIAVQEGVGHTSLAAPSSCMIALVNEYFATGKASHKRCAQEQKPFFGQETAKRDISGIDMGLIGRALARQSAR